MDEIKIEKISQINRDKVNELIKNHWYSTTMAIRGKLINMSNLPGFIAILNDEIIGMITYKINLKECEIISLDSFIENKGIGTELLQSVISEAKDNCCEVINLITTNDNLNAMKFYQKRGFDFNKVFVNAVDKARALKPSIPKVGDYNIPIKHEIEFIKYVNRP